MSLSIALQQIQKPSWMPPDAPTRLSTKHYQEKRKEIAKAIRENKKPVGYSWIVEYTGYTRQAVQNVVGRLVDSGELVRIESDNVNGLGVMFDVPKTIEVTK